MSSKKHIINGAFAAIIAAAVLAAGAMAGCGEKSESKSATPDTVVETQVVTEIVNGVYVDENGNAITDPSGNPIKATESATKAADSKTSKTESKQQSSSSGSASSKTESKQQSSSSGSASGKTESKSSSDKSQSSASSKTDSGSRKPTPSGASDSKTKQETKKDDSAKELTISGKSYKVGDKVTCTYYLTVPNQMLNFQGRVQYDSSMLKKTNAYLVAPASYNSLLNPNLDGRVVFNGSDLSGYDFKDPGYEFLVVEYEVLKTGSTEPAITFEVLTDTGDKAYAGGNGALTNGAKVSAVYS